MVGNSNVKVIDREPIWRKVEDKIDNGASRVRNTPGQKLRQTLPKLENRNVGGGVIAGAIEAGIAILLKDSLGFPLQSEVEISDVEAAQGGTLYTVNVDAVTQNQARAEAFFNATVGFTSLLTDELNVESAEVLKTRVLRDTYQVEILVQD